MSVFLYLCCNEMLPIEKKIEGRSLDISHENLHKLHTLFPNMLRDGKNRYKTLKKTEREIQWI